MLDIEKAKEVFNKYVENYNPKDKKIEIKIEHIQRVSQISKTIAETLNLNEQDIKLAELIGLLHDIGRFEQVKRYHTFIDKDSINHGEYGVKILFENGLIREFIDTDKYDEIIKLSILNHNRAKIEKGLTKKEELFSKIIRDADKLDIFYVLTIGDKKAIWESEDLSDDIISDEIYREFMEEKNINYNERKTSADILISHFAYIYDLNFKQSLDVIVKNGYLEKVYKRFKFNNADTKEKYDNIYREAIKYSEKKDD